MPHVSLAYVLRIYWGGAEAALAAEAGRAARSAARSPCINVSLGTAPAGTAATAATATISRRLHPHQTFDVDFDVSFDVNAELHQTRFDVHFDVHTHHAGTSKYIKYRA